MYLRKPASEFEIVFASEHDSCYNGRMLGVIYTRVSSPRQAQTGSLAQQELDCLRYCEENGIDVVAVFKDDGTGTGEGPQKNKPQLHAAVELGREHKAIEALVVA